MKWITREGKDMFNLQANAFDISQGIREDLDMQVIDLGVTITGFNVMSFNYPKEIQDRITKTASHSMVGDVGKYQQIEMVDGISSGKVKGGGAAGDMAGMMMGMTMAKEMMGQTNNQGVQQQGHSGGGQPQNPQQTQQQSQQQGQQPPTEQPQGSAGNIPNFCPNCGEKTSGGNF